MRYSMCGDTAFTIELGREANVLLARTIAGLHSALTECAPPGFIESIPGLTSLTVLFDPEKTSALTLQQDIMRLVDTHAYSTTRARAWHIPVCYEDECAPDLFDVAQACGMSPQQVIAAHTQRSYVVYLLGFSPGFPYLGDLDARLELPRLTEPRTRVPAGSVAIATRYTAIYPQSTAGGWHIIGRTPLTLFDPRACPPALLAAGDTVRFQAVDSSEYQRICAECSTCRNADAP